MTVYHSIFVKIEVWKKDFRISINNLDFQDLSFVILILEDYFNQYFYLRLR